LGVLARRVETSLFIQEEPLPLERLPEQVASLIRDGPQFLLGELRQAAVLGCAKLDPDALHLLPAETKNAGPRAQHHVPTDYF
jgi:hypothetical protein